jgi:hypothetical protein
MLAWAKRGRAKHGLNRIDAGVLCSRLPAHHTRAFPNQITSWDPGPAFCWLYSSAHDSKK